MVNLDLYKHNNHLQRKESRLCLERFGNRIHWRSKASVIDLGSGDGAVTCDILQKFLPEDFERLIGVDICKNMVLHSNEHYSSDRLSFQLMDIEGDLPPHFLGSFDHVFSFFTLHWALDQEKAFKNVFDLLSAGGECLLLTVASSSVFEGWRVMSQGPKWGPISGPIEGVVSMRYQNAQDPKKEMYQLLEGVGFNKIHIDLEETYYVYDDYEQFRKFGQSLNPFKVSGKLLDEFGEDFARTMLKHDLVDRVEDKDTAVKSTAVWAIIYGTK